MHNQGAEDALLRQMWGLGAASARGPRPRYTLSDIADAGVALADVDGLNGVSLGAVAARLGLTTTALYRYVDSKDSLLHVMVDAAIGPPPRLRTQTWTDRVQEWTRKLWTAYRTHPWIRDVPAGGEPRYPNQLAWMDLVLGELDEGTVADPLRAALLLDGVARSFASLGPATPTPPWLTDVIAARHPRLAHELDRDWSDVEAELVGAVETILRGSRSSVRGG